MVSGTTISSTVENGNDSDFASGLTNCITRDGQSPATANIPLGANRLTGVANAVGAQDAVTFTQAKSLIQGGASMLVGAVAGTNTVTGNLTPAITALATGMLVTLVPANTNTGAATLNLNAIGAANILANGAVLSGGELIAGRPYLLIVTGAGFNLQPWPSSGIPIGPAQSASASPVIDFDLNTYPSAFDGTYRKITLDLITVKPATDDVYGGLRIGTGVVPTWQAGAAAYGYGGQMAATGGAAANGIGSVLDSVDTLIALTRPGAGQGVGNAAGECLNATIVLKDLNSASYKPISYTSSYIRSDGLIASVQASGNYGATTALTGIRFLFSSGNIASGIFVLTGEK